MVKGNWNNLSYGWKVITYLLQAITFLLHFSKCKWVGQYKSQSNINFLKHTHTHTGNTRAMFLYINHLSATTTYVAATT